MTLVVSVCLTQLASACADRPSPSAQDSTRTPVAQSPIAMAPSPTEVTRAQNLIARLRRRYPFMRVKVWGVAGDHAFLALPMPLTNWVKLSRTDRVALLRYMGGVVNNARTAPDEFLDVPPSAPAYAFARARILQMSEGNWEILVGTVLKSHGRPIDMEVDSAVACGDAEAGCAAAKRASALLATMR